MGLVLDSSVLIAAERKSRPVSELLATIQDSAGHSTIVISAITVIELEHGLWRANTAAIAQQRKIYLDGIYESIPIEPFSKEMGQLAARIDAEARKNRVVIPFADLQIGVTALYLDHGIVTLNPWHFELIPGLTVRGL